MDFSSCYEDVSRADAYATLEFANTYCLAYRDLPAIMSEHAFGTKAIAFGCGAGPVNAVPAETLPQCDWRRHLGVQAADLRAWILRAINAWCLGTVRP